MKRNPSSNLELNANMNTRKLDKKSTSFVPAEKDSKIKQPNISLNDMTKQFEEKIAPLMISFDEKEYQQTLELIMKLRKKDTREESFKQLSNRRETDKNLAVLLWHSVGTIALILQEIIMIYPLLNNLCLSCI